MKTIEKNIFRNESVDAFIREQLQQIEHASAIDAEHDGLNNRPSLAEENPKSFFAEYNKKFQALMDYAAAEIQPVILQSEVAESEKITARKLQDLHNNLMAIKGKTAEHEKEIKSTERQYGAARMPLVWCAMFIPLLGDAIVNLPAFESYGYNFIEAACVALLLAGALGVLGHSFGKLTALGKTLWQRRLIAGGIFALVGILFLYLAITRAEFLSNAANTQSDHTVHFSAIPFAALSMLLFVIAVAINKFFYPTDQQRKANRAYDEARKKQQTAIAELKQIEQEIEALKHKHEELYQTNSSIYVYGGKLEEFIMTSAHILFEKFKKINVAHRPDRGRPLAFNSEYPFTFKTHFKDINLF